MAKKTTRKRSTGLARVGTMARYAAENDLSTLKQAEEIRGDSKRFSNAKKVGVKQVSAIKKVLTKKA